MNSNKHFLVILITQLKKIVTLLVIVYAKQFYTKVFQGYVNRLANMAKVFYQFDDFIRMRAYDPKY